jgi:hypothetical protein
LALIIFALTILPMTYLRMEVTGQDGIYSHIIGGHGALNVVLSGNQDKVNFDSGVLIFIKMVLWSTFPIFFIFLPYGIFSIFKKDHKNLVMLLTVIMFLIPTLYISIRGVSETKYLLILYPIFTLFSIFMIQKINERIKKKNIFLLIVVICTIFSSIVFLSTHIDNEYEREAVFISNEIIKRTTIINDYHPQSIYLRTVEFSDDFRYTGNHDYFQTEIKVLHTKKYETLQKFLNFAQKENLEYLIVDNSRNRSDFIISIFENEEKYPFLEKEFDSNNLGFKYKVKIFKINYEIFNENNN